MRLTPLALATLATSSLSADVLKGRVVDTADKPISGAFVALASDTGSAGPRRTLTDRTGAYRLKVEPMTPGLMLSAWAPGFRPITQGSGNGLRFRLERGQEHLLGTVKGPREGWISFFPSTLTAAPAPGEQVSGGVVPFRGGRLRAALPEGDYYFGLDSNGFKTETLMQKVSASAPFTVAMKPLPKPATPAVQAWLRTAAHPLKGVTAGLGFADLQPFKAMVGDARIVGLGEATHGTREFFQMKHRLLEFLISEMGFTVFAIEASLPDTLPLDTYVMTGEGDPERLVHGMGFWTWDTEEVLDLVRWVRAWNANPANTRKVRFLGVDMQRREGLVSTLAARLKRASPERAAKVEATFGPLDMRWGIDPKVPAAERTARRTEAEALLADLTARKEDSLTVQLARVLVQNLRMVEASINTDKGSFESRDEAMAANTTWALEQGGPGARMVLWAHNSHISRFPLLGMTTLGCLLAKQYGKAYCPLGFAFHQGGFQAVGPMDTGLQPFEVRPADTSSLSQALAKLHRGVTLLDLRAIPTAGGVRAWFQDSRSDWEVGSAFEPGASSAYRPYQAAMEAFDLLIHMDRTTRARPLPRSLQIADLPIQEVHSSPRNLTLQGSGGWAFYGPGHRFQKSELTCLEPLESRQGNVYQTVDAKPYCGRRVRWVVQVSGEATGLSGLEKGARVWLRPEGPMGLLDLHVAGRSLKPTDGSQRIIVEGTVPRAAQSLSFGVTLNRGGRIRMEEAELVVLD